MVVTFTPQSRRRPTPRAQLVGKLATLMPPPRVHGVRYHGVFALDRLEAIVMPAGRASG
jgi:hypothetical protein